jgi:hypothetical protein
MSAAVGQRVQLAAVVGERAHTAIIRCGGVLRPLPAFPDSPYMLAGEEIVWLGGAGGPWHPRRVLLAQSLGPLARDNAGRVHVSLAGARVWRCDPLPRIGPERLAGAGLAIRRNLIRDCVAIGTPAGFGALLAGDTLRFPLDRASGNVRPLALAVQCNDAAAFEAAALPLLGLGLGLTPSGDDLIGACLFARRLRGPDVASDVAWEAAWEHAAHRLMHAAAARSNAISAALFGDLARGAAYSPLHELAAAAGATACDETALLAAVRALTAIGHSSGWDMLTGFVIGTAAAEDGIDWKATPGGHFQPSSQATQCNSLVSSRLVHLARPAQDVTP